MKHKSYFLIFLIVFLTGFIYLDVQAQQSKSNHRADFSGVWKSKESISMGGNIFCAYNLLDRMSSKTMIITSQANFLTIETPSSSAEINRNKHQEKLPFDGKESQITYGLGGEKKFKVKWSADGQTLTVNSTSYQQQVVHYVTEVWRLSSDGKAISIQAKAKSNVWGEERLWTTVFDKAN